MIRPWLGLIPFWLAQAGCTVTAVNQQQDPRPQNSCGSDSDCSDNAHCSQGLCQTLNGQLETLFIAATPPSDSSLPHLTFVANVEDIPTSGGTKDLQLPGASTVHGALVLPKSIDCYPTFTDPENPHVQSSDQSLPVQVTLELRQRLLGLPQQIYFANTPNDPVKGHYAFDIQVPAGAYDVYLVPPAGQSSCPIPPQLIRNQLIDEGTFDIPFSVAAVSKLTLKVHWPKLSASLEGWVADIIEPIGGKPISTQVVLTGPFDAGEFSKTLDYTVELVYSAAAEPEATDASVMSAHELLRLRPPATTVAPTIYLDRTAIELFKGPVEYSEFTQYPQPVEVQGQLVRLDTGAPVAGDVTLVSTQIHGVDDGIFASFQTSAKVGENGVFTVHLPPGVYKVQAVPPLPDAAPTAPGGLAAIETSWLISADVAVQGGRLLELPPLAVVTGQGRVQGAQVQALPVPQSVLPFDQAFGENPFSPRVSTAVVDETGHFTVQTDPGEFNLSVQAPEELGFAWFVRLGVQIGQGNEDLGRAVPTVPSMLSGKVSIGDFGVLPSGSVRAYAYLDKNLAYTRDPKLAVSVVQVAETRTDEAGAFRLLIPASIDDSK